MEDLIKKALEIYSRVKENHPSCLDLSNDFAGCIEAPFFTCEVVISEACFLLRTSKEGTQVIFKMMERGVIEIPFRLDYQVHPISKLMGKYCDVSMS
ncbi:hypothetical protein JW926_10490 [Candidatus Sumerlaeota bacterium]|nr:hypothetical protein [Candidatus Sumerlaeota bacterium]